MGSSRPVANVDIGYPPTLLCLFIPHGHDQYQGGRDTGFKDSQDGSTDHQTGVILASCMSSEHDAPKHDVGPKILPNPRDAL